MKAAMKYVFMITFCLAMSGYLHAQVSSTAANIGIDAKVIAPITISNVSSTKLDFGTVSRSSVAGTVTVPPVGARTSSGGVSVLTSSLYSSAPFEVSGENNASYNLTLPDNDEVTLTREGGSEEMEVINFTTNSTLVLGASGSATFNVGATLSLDADQFSGEYSGSFSVTVAYQ